jgi:hypothetical protein
VLLILLLKNFAPKFSLVGQICKTFILKIFRFNKKLPVKKESSTDVFGVVVERLSHITKVQGSIPHNSLHMCKSSDRSFMFREVSKDADLARSGLCRFLSGWNSSPAGIWLDCSPASHKTLIGTSARKWWTVETQGKKSIKSNNLI